MELFDAHQYHWWFVIRAIHIKSRDRISINVAKTHEYKLRNYVWSRFLVMNIFDGLLNVKSTKAITYFPCISVQLIRAPNPQLTCNYSIGNILWDWVIFTLHTIHPMFYVSVDREKERRERERAGRRQHKFAALPIPSNMIIPLRPFRQTDGGACVCIKSGGSRYNTKQPKPEINKGAWPHGGIMCQVGGLRIYDS